MNKGNVVWMLCHFCVREGQDETETDKTELSRKDIGIYSSREKAQEAMDRLVNLEGFRDYPGGFRFYDALLDHDVWTCGFMTYP